MVDRLGLPLMLKPDQGGSALGSQVVRERRSFPRRWSAASRTPTPCWPSVSSPAPRCRLRRSRRGGGARLPPVEVDAGGVYDYTARYTPGAATFHCPARLDDMTLAALAETALAAHQLLGLRDVSRMDAVVDGDGRVQILEVNVSPGLTETSLLPTAVRAAGMKLGDLYAAWSSGRSRDAEAFHVKRRRRVSRETRWQAHSSVGRSMSFAMRSRSSTDPNSTTIRPLR